MPVSSSSGKSFWVASVAGSVPEHRPLGGDVAVDVAVIGGGIVGLTAAVLLQQAGKRIAVVEARKVVSRLRADRPRRSPRNTA
jgi:glycine/D-amino acid oxidase-like deaminating enzyme